jgi:hypothetical protein
MPQLPMRAGLGSVHLLRSGLAPEMTSEQRIRGADAGVDWALLATGYERDALSDLEQGVFSRAELEKRGATDVASATYQAAYTLTDREVAP